MAPGDAWDPITFSDSEDEVVAPAAGTVNNNMRLAASPPGGNDSGSGASENESDSGERGATTAEETQHDGAAAWGSPVPLSPALFEAARADAQAAAAAAARAEAVAAASASADDQMRAPAARGALDGTFAREPSPEDAPPAPEDDATHGGVADNSGNANAVASGAGVGARGAGPVNNEGPTRHVAAAAAPADPAVRALLPALVTEALAAAVARAVKARHDAPGKPSRSNQRVRELAADLGRNDELRLQVISGEITPQALAAMDAPDRRTAKQVAADAEVEALSLRQSDLTALAAEAEARRRELELRRGRDAEPPGAELPPPAVPPLLPQEQPEAAACANNMWLDYAAAAMDDTAPEDAMALDDDQEHERPPSPAPLFLAPVPAPQPPTCPLASPAPPVAAAPAMPVIPAPVAAPVVPVLPPVAPPRVVAAPRDAARVAAEAQAGRLARTVLLECVPSWAGPAAVRSACAAALGPDAVDDVRVFEDGGRFAFRFAQVLLHTTVLASRLRACRVVVGDTEVGVLTRAAAREPRGKRVRDDDGELAPPAPKRARATTPPLPPMPVRATTLPLSMPPMAMRATTPPLPPAPPPVHPLAAVPLLPMAMPSDPRRAAVLAALPQPAVLCCIACRGTGLPLFPAARGPACVACIVAAAVAAQKASDAAPPADLTPVYDAAGDPAALVAVQLRTTNADACAATLHPCGGASPVALPPALTQLRVLVRATVERVRTMLGHAKPAQLRAWEVRPPAGGGADCAPLERFAAAIKGRTDAKPIGVVQEGLPDGHSMFLIPRAEAAWARQLLGIAPAPVDAAMLAVYVAAPAFATAAM